MSLKRFALIGASGFVAPRHVDAIKKTGNNLIAAVDPHDSVGYLDNYFPKANFFTEFERFDRFIDKCRGQKNNIDYVSVCSPNYLHDTHVKSSLRWGADVICEKPLVINPWNIRVLEKIEHESGKKVWNVLQLRQHPSIIALKKKVEAAVPSKIFDVDLTYITSRGKWYYSSWKGHDKKSGGIATNIGIHFFDMLSWVFGNLKDNIVHIHSHDRAAGYFEFERARVRWFLSINEDNLPNRIKKSNKKSLRSIIIDDKEFDFSTGFTNLHTKVYNEIMSGRGNGIKDVRNAIEISHSIRTQKPIGLNGNYHPLAKDKINLHPFIDSNL